MEETISTRMILESGRNLTIVSEEWNETWKVSTYNKNMEMYSQLFPDEKSYRQNKKRSAKEL